MAKRTSAADAMTMSRLGLLVVAVMLALGAPVPAQQATPALPDTPPALTRLMSELYAATQANDQAKARALIRALALPRHEAWFGRTFGEPAAAKLSAEYAAVLARFDTDASGAFANVVQKGQSEVQVLRFERAGDPRAVGNQNDALAAMKSPQPLYSVRFVKPGERLGLHLYSFVHADGSFRYVGRMTAAKP